MEISDIIEQQALALGCLYLRAIPSDANDYVERTELSDQTLVIYSNHPNVSVAVQNYLKLTYPITIQVVKLGNFDDNTVDSDILINQCRSIAIQLAMNILNSIEGVVYPDNIAVDPFDTIQVMDDILTGVTIGINVEYPYTCVPPSSNGIFDYTFDKTFN